jgi:hypothetical protein
MMIGYDIYDRFTMEHFPLCQIMILTTSFFYSRQYNMKNIISLKVRILGSNYLLTLLYKKLIGNVIATLKPLIFCAVLRSATKCQRGNFKSDLT